MCYKAVPRGVGACPGPSRERDIGSLVRLLHQREHDVVVVLDVGRVLGVGDRFDLLQPPYYEERVEHLVPSSRAKPWEVLGDEWWNLRRSDLRFATDQLGVSPQLVAEEFLGIHDRAECFVKIEHPSTGL